MKTETLRKLVDVQKDLMELVVHGKEQAARPDAGQICRLSDSAINRYETASNAIGDVLDGFKGIADQPLTDALRQLADVLVTNTLAYRKETGDEYADVGDANYGWKKELQAIIVDTWAKHELIEKIVRHPALG